MANSVQDGSESQARSDRESSGHDPSQAQAQPAPAAIGKGTLAIAVIALIIGLIFGYTMSTVGLR